MPPGNAKLGIAEFKVSVTDNDQRTTIGAFDATHAGRLAAAPISSTARSCSTTITRKADTGKQAQGRDLHLTMQAYRHLVCARVHRYGTHMLPLLSCVHQTQSRRWVTDPYAVSGGMLDGWKIAIDQRHACAVRGKYGGRGRVLLRITARLLVEGHHMRMKGTIKPTMRDLPDHRDDSLAAGNGGHEHRGRRPPPPPCLAARLASPIGGRSGPGEDCISSMAAAATGTRPKTAFQQPGLVGCGFWLVGTGPPGHPVGAGASAACATWFGWLNRVVPVLEPLCPC